MNKKTAVLLLTVLIMVVVGGCINQASQKEQIEYTLNWSDGSCFNDNDCEAFEYGCGGNHIVCTSNTTKWKDVISTCEVLENHPSQLGYECSCVVSENKCGWSKRA